MARLIFIFLFLPFVAKAAFVDSVRINPLGNTVQVSGTVQTNITNSTVAVTQSTSPWIVSGVTTVSNFPAYTGLTNSELRASPVPVSGTITANVTFPVSQSVNVLNLPATQIVSGSVSVNNQISGFATETTLAAINTKTPTPTQRTPGYTSTSTTGTVSAGAKTVSFFNAGFFNATVLGTTLGAGDSITFDAPDQDTLGAITYSGTGTTLRILEVR